MDNPLFKRLQEAIERPCRSKEWFPMAEQAINTVYALGERPDLLCSSLIKNLTRRVFARKSNPLAASQEPKEKDPDAMDEDEDNVDPETTQQTQAIQRQDFRPSFMATNPAVAELMNAPRVIRDEINCWRTVVMFQPIAVPGAR